MLEAPPPPLNQAGTAQGARERRRRGLVSAEPMSARMGRPPHRAGTLSTIHK